MVGTLEDIESLKKGVEFSDAVIHLAYIHDFSTAERFFESGTIDMNAILATGEVLKGSEKPLVIAAGIAGINDNHLLTEDFRNDMSSLENSPRRSELAAYLLENSGVNVSVVRLPPAVYGNGTSGFIEMLSEIAKNKNVSGYINDGNNKWSAVHYKDAAKLFQLIVEQKRQAFIMQ